ncbi:hypothetical protein [Halomonas korlensis]|uniref:Uncharacterized protein n=1 Tax=Halomonas korlensis TaxID=463301 RepID=A0A1I7JM44_9GAMM|nr:hypothetical protein [Halomonas korlensis]SFU86231.1 hypothetical protein SAMN04487955_11163 [Halomonas korlensis]
MAITTIEQALSSMGDELKTQQVANQARDALDSGHLFEIVLAVRSAKQGVVVTMETRESVIKKFPTFIRLQ